MTVEEFRKHKYLPQQWRKLLSTNGILQTVLQVMEENHPARFAIRGDRDEDVSPTRAAIELGFTRGYSKYADTLMKLAVSISPAMSPGETTYLPPPKDEITPP